MGWLGGCFREGVVVLLPCWMVCGVGKHVGCPACVVSGTLLRCGALFAEFFLECVHSVCEAPAGDFAH